MSGPEISNMKNQFWAVGHWSGLDCEIKGSGPIMSNFFGLFFHFFGVKIFFFNFLTPKKWKKGPQKLVIIGPDPFISQSSPDQWPTAQNWFFILWNLGTRHLFSYLCIKLIGLGSMMLMDQLELVEIAYKLTTRQFDGKKALDTQGDILTGIGLISRVFLQCQIGSSIIASKVFLETTVFLLPLRTDNFWWDFLHDNWRSIFDVVERL